MRERGLDGLELQKGRGVRVRVRACVLGGGGGLVVMVVVTVMMVVTVIVHQPVWCSSVVAGFPCMITQAWFTTETESFVGHGHLFFCFGNLRVLFNCSLFPLALWTGSKNTNSHKSQLYEGLVGKAYVAAASLIL